MVTEPPLGNVLVVGGCGFLGHHIVQQLLDSGRAAAVSVFDLSTARNRLPDVSYTAGDLCSAADVAAVLAQAQPRVVIHTASPVPLSRNVGIYEKVNVGGTRTLLEAAAAAPSVRAFVYTSSASVVHDGVSDLREADEQLPVLRMPAQTDPYAHTKGLADELVLAANGDSLRTCCIRPAGLFGEGDALLASSMIQSAAAGKMRFQMGDGTNEFDFTYIANAAQAHLLAADALLHVPEAGDGGDGPVDGQAFFITNGEPIAFWDFARSLGGAAGFPTPAERVWVIPRWAGLLLGTLAEWVVWALSLGRRQPNLTRARINFSCMTRTYRIAKARRRLGYAPRVGLREGIARTGRWWSEAQRQGKPKQG